METVTYECMNTHCTHTHWHTKLNYSSVNPGTGRDPQIQLNLVEPLSADELWGDAIIVFSFVPQVRPSVPMNSLKLLVTKTALGSQDKNQKYECEKGTYKLERNIDRCVQETVEVLRQE